MKEINNSDLQTTTTAIITLNKTRLKIHAELPPIQCHIVSLLYLYMLLVYVIRNCNTSSENGGSTAQNKDPFIF